MSEDLNERQAALIAEIVKRCPDPVSTVTAPYLGALLRRDPARVAADLALLERRQLLESGSAPQTYRPTAAARDRFTQ